MPPASTAGQGDVVVPPADPAPPGALGRALARVHGDGRYRDLFTAVMLFAVGLLLLEVELVGVWSAESALGTAAATTPEPWWRVALLGVGCALVLVERARPVLALLGGVVVTVVDDAWGGSLAILLVLWELLFNAALRTGPRSRAWLWGTAVALTAIGAVAAGEAERDVRYFVYGGLQIGAILLVPMWWADNVRVKTGLADAERARADDLAALAEAERHEAVQAERAAMARDLHDVIASHLSTIAIHSGAALASPPDAGRDRAALEQVRASSVASLTEMRSMIDLLRAGSALDPVTAPRRMDGLGTLVADARAAGVDVTVDDPDGVADDALPAAAGQALHRIAQEALTNARKHSPGAAVTIRLTRDVDVVMLQVRSAALHGDVPALPEPVLSAGTGLFSMRERAEALGGDLTAGPTPGGSWAVRATVPVGEGAS